MGEYRISCVSSLSAAQRFKQTMTLEPYVLNWVDHEQVRASSLQSLWKQQDFLDVTIACDDDQIEAHKVVLSAASPFFQNILKRNPHSHPLLYLRGTTKKDMEAILEFIYSGTTKVIQEDLEHFIELAKSLHVNGLCEYDIASTEDNYVEFPTSGEIIAGKNKENEPSGKKSMGQKKRRKKSTKEETVVKDIDEIAGLENESANYMLDMAINSLNTFLEPEKSKENPEFQKNDFMNTSIAEYDEKVLELVEKSEIGWKCRQCPYERKASAHVNEHVEMHITGFLLSCNLCDRTFTHKRQIRHHKSRHHKPAL